MAPSSSASVLSTRRATPPFYVNARKNLFYCHGCGWGGDLLRFIQLSRQLSFRQSLGYLEQHSAPPADPAAVLERDLAIVPSASLRSGLNDMLDSLRAAQHVLEMFRRTLPIRASHRRLRRLSNRLSKILREARKLAAP